MPIPEFEQESAPETLMVNGEKVVLFSPVYARITIRCPFPPRHINEPPTLEEKQFVMNRATSILHYMRFEGMLNEKLGTVNIEVLTEFSKPL